MSAKTIMITGACGVIGKALAKHWDTSHHLLLLDSDSLALQAFDDELEGDHTLVPFDLWTSSPKLYQTLAEMIEQDHGKLDALIHLAAYCGNLRPIVQTDAEHWLKMLQVNLTAPHWLTQTLFPLLQKSEAGKIGFTIFDVTENTPQAHYWHGFGVAQAGLTRLIRDLKEESQAYPTLSIADINPGWTDSRMARTIFPNGRNDWVTLESIPPLYDQLLTLPTGHHASLTH